MPRIFYDSVTASDIPVTVNGKPIDGVLGYVDGKYAWSNTDWARFDPATVRVRIAINPTTVADVLDVEPGNPATAADAASWVALCKAHGVVRPTVYCSASEVDYVKAATGNVDFDVADWTGKPHQVDNAPCVQYASPETGSGGHFDLNVVWDDTWHPAQTSVVAPAPAPVPVVPVVPVDPVEVAAMSFPELFVGATGTPVRKAQGLLNAFGYGLVEDGSYGPKTEGAVLGFQRNHPPLVVDGAFGPQTCAKALSA